MRDMFRNKEVKPGVLVKTLETIEQPRESSDHQNNEMGAEEVCSVSEGTRVCWKSGVKKYREQDEGCRTQSAGLMLQLGYQMSLTGLCV